MRADLLVGATELHSGPVAQAWELPAVEGEQEADRLLELVLALLSESRSAVLRAEASPAGAEGLPGTWVELAPDQWRLPDDEIDLGDLLDLLSGESWQLVGFDHESPVAVAPIDLFEAVEEAPRVLHQAGAAWVVDVWTDALPYRILRRLDVGGSVGG